LNEQTLPGEFRELQPFVGKWAVRTMPERHRRRLESTAEERDRFYRAMSPRLDAVIDYLNQLPLRGMPAGADTLLELALSLMEVSLTQEVYDAKTEAIHAQSARFVHVQKGLDDL
jgi:hypothetical protein